MDLGGRFSTGIMGIAYNKLKAHLGIRGGRTRMYDLGQQLAEPEVEVLERIGADVLPLLIWEPKEWKESTLPDNSLCEVPVDFNPEVLPDGPKVLRDDEGRIVAKMPKDGYYFDGVYHPLEKVSTIEELEQQDLSVIWSRKHIDEATLNDLQERAKQLYENTNYALMLNGAGGIYEAAQGLRGWANFMVDLLRNPDFAGFLLDKLVEANIKRLEEILPAVKSYVQIVQVGDDLGMQNGPQISPKLYKEVVKPRHKRFYRYIKDHTVHTSSYTHAAQFTTSYQTLSRWA